ncbi:MAG: helix-turn-helix domain-containing protein [Bryobacterales bacterium]|nr:helix-turn-helix domain-containing protein [Bryobacterales bacterium]
MRFYKEVNTPEPKTPVTPPRTEPMRSKERPPLDETERLADLNMVARRLGVSTRYVQQLTRRKVIPVIRLGRRCTRYDLEAVLAAIRRYEVQEMGRAA